MKNTLGEINFFRIIVGVNIALFFIAIFFQFIAGEFSQFDLEFISMMGVFNSQLVVDGKLWLLLSFNFVHFDIIHFMFNIYALYTLGSISLNYFSQKNIFSTYIISGLVAGLSTYAYAITSDIEVTTLGASGAIFGVLGLQVGATLRKDKAGNKLINLDISSFYPTLIAALIISFLPQVNVAAHVGGFLTGLVLSLIMNPSEFSDKKETKTEDSCFYFSITIFAISGIFYIINFVNVFYGN